MQYLEDLGATYPYVIRIGKSDHVFEHVLMHEIYTWAEKSLGERNVLWMCEIDWKNNELEFRFLNKKAAMTFKLKWS